ncbi:MULTISPECIES: acetyl-CoA C-acyltransferase [unclassified Herbaspirillum]|uniref:acetyl-CoA C-acyltransferase n=1 Tax=unclassified Herbaspirillum TaxID=2624150 RepID=UPI000E2F2B5B|nr:MULTISPECIES: acetyl-CoA C-acyltransferase [unclassified Herbaspirillum]RFB69955.1 acetyl-CoA C-acyltransferase [Herbaspirillum sp. 3R-3a1]TFI06978.1 acetyl-CoA C-acyltransferase [Herbaspirillum sp. 3R11]TFI12916.1 acetyl-CoA C-acyltransferase [Herbaspirillum sp. 3R-11]TFI20129.1 acetyl-CoA C-acyltransferase [Herbaspirillum sp. 3C11]
MNDAVILGWGRSAVTPLGGALSQLQAHEIAAPVVQGILQRFGIPLTAIDAVIAGNAMGAGGNPARMLALAAGFNDRIPALSVDSQCCAGLDAIALAHGMLAAGNADVVIAGGVEAWSRAPIRQHRPRHAGEAAITYDSPAFAPDPARDPDMLLAAARHALKAGITREQQDAWAVQSHARAVAARAHLQNEIIGIGPATQDSYPRALNQRHLARMPVLTMSDDVSVDEATRQRHAVSRIAVSPSADGAAFVVIATRDAARRLNLRPHFAWRAGVSVGALPETPMLAAIDAAQAALARTANSIDDLWGVELHDAFAAQAIAFCEALKLSPEQLNRHGGGLGRGHPIGASGAISLVRLLADMQQEAPHGALGLAAIAAAGGLGAAAVVERC